MRTTTSRKSDIEKVAAALHDRWHPKLPWPDCYNLAETAVNAMRPRRKPGPKPKPGRTYDERSRKPITEADWELYFQRRQQA